MSTCLIARPSNMKRYLVIAQSVESARPANTPALDERQKLVRPKVFGSVRVQAGRYRCADPTPSLEVTSCRFCFRAAERTTLAIGAKATRSVKDQTSSCGSGGSMPSTCSSSREPGRDRHWNPRLARRTATSRQCASARFDVATDPLVLRRCGHQWNAWARRCCCCCGCWSRFIPGRVHRRRTAAVAANAHPAPNPRRRRRVPAPRCPWSRRLGWS